LSKMNEKIGSLYIHYGVFSHDVRQKMLGEKKRKHKGTLKNVIRRLNSSWGYGSIPTRSSFMEGRPR